MSTRDSKISRPTGDARPRKEETSLSDAAAARSQFDKTWHCRSKLAQLVKLKSTRYSRRFKLVVLVVSQSTNQGVIWSNNVGCDIHSDFIRDGAEDGCSLIDRPAAQTDMHSLVLSALPLTGCRMAKSSKTILFSPCIRFRGQISNSMIADVSGGNDRVPLSSHSTWGQKVTLFAKAPPAGQLLVVSGRRAGRHGPALLERNWFAER